MFQKVKPKKDKNGLSKKSKSDIIIYLKDKKRLISHNIFNYKKDISDILSSYKKTSDKNNALYQDYKQNYENFEKINSKIRQQHKPQEEKLISDLINDYYHKRKMNLTSEDIKSNIFEISPLIEPSISKLNMEYLLNFDEMKKEMDKKSDINIISEKKLKKFENQDKLNNKNLPRINLSKLINCLKDVKFLKKMNICTKIKMLESNVYKGQVNKTEFKKQLEELEKNAALEENLKCQKDIKNSLKDINFLKKNIKDFELNEIEKKKEKERANVKNANTTKESLFSNQRQRSQSLFYIPTLVKSFPELLYDKFNKNANNISKNIPTNDSSNPSLIKTNDLISHTQRSLYKNASIIMKNTSRPNIDNENKFINVIDNNKLKLKRIESKIFKKFKASKASRTAKINTNKFMNNTTYAYNHISRMSEQDKNSIKNYHLLSDFLKVKKNQYLNSVNENRPRNYFKSLKKIHSQFKDDRNAQKLYEHHNLLYNKKAQNWFNDINNFQKTLRTNEKLLIKSLLIEK